jgi:uncharacterized protein YkwD
MSGNTKAKRQRRGKSAPKRKAKRKGKIRRKGHRIGRVAKRSVPRRGKAAPNTSVSAAGSVASRNRKAKGSDNTHCRSGRSGSTSSAGSAAVSVMRRAPHEGQNPRFLQLSRRVLELVNEARASGRRCGGKYYPPVPPLVLDAALTRAALAHSRDMAAHDDLDHRGGDGSTPGMRVQRAGFGDHRIVGENIAAGAMTAADVTQGWLASPAHCENIMDGRFTLIGIAYAENLRTRSAVFWTQDFAAHP